MAGQGRAGQGRAGQGKARLGQIQGQGQGKETKRRKISQNKIRSKEKWLDRCNTKDRRSSSENNGLNMSFGLQNVILPS